MDALRETGVDVQEGKSEVVRRAESEEGARKRRGKWIGGSRNWKRRKKKVSNAQSGDGHCVHRVIDDPFSLPKVVPVQVLDHSFGCPAFPTTTIPGPSIFQTHPIA